MEPIKAKMCVSCNRLLDVDVLQCPCGETEFAEVTLSLEEEDSDDTALVLN